MDPYPYLWLAAACFLIGALLEVSQMSLMVLPDSNVRRMRDSLLANERRIVRLLSFPAAFRDGMALGLLTAIGGGGVFLLMGISSTPFGEWLASHTGWFGMAVNFAFFALVMMIINLFCFLLPTRVAIFRAATLAPLLSGLATACVDLMSPFVCLSRILSRVLGRLFGVPTGEMPIRATEEEIRFLVDMGNEKGEIEKSEKEMINNIFDFDDRCVSEIMTHRTDLVAVPLETTLDEIVAIAMDSGYSRIPVYNAQIDNIEGILYIKDLLCLIGKHNTDFCAKSYMRKVLFIPENVLCVDLFAQFKQKKLQVAVAVDEYGGTAGLVTMEDLVESIVGNIQDEYDDEAEEIHRLSEECYLLDGTLSIAAVENLFGVRLDDSDDSEYDTIGGLLIEALDRLPEPDEHPTLTLAGISFEVMLVEDRRIARIRAQRLSLL